MAQNGRKSGFFAQRRWILWTAGAVAAVILLVISNVTTITFDNASGVVLLVLALIVLFILKEFFIDNKKWIDRLVGNVPSEPTNKDNETKDASRTFPRRIRSIFTRLGKL